ncbi:E3 ubiquitin-protein ligase HRD1 [Linum perenne]
MDPSPTNLLQEEEVETMHSGSDIETFQAGVVNREIGGDEGSSSQPPNSVEGSHSSSQLLHQNQPQEAEHMPGTQEQAESSNNQRGEVPFVFLLRALTPHIDALQLYQLRTIFRRLANGEIVKDEFVMQTRMIMGDRVLKQAIAKWEAQEDLERLETFDGDDCCAICLEEMHCTNDGRKMIRPECKHVFHEQCLLSWLLNSSLCPLCRLQITK